MVISMPERERDIIRLAAGLRVFDKHEARPIRGVFVRVDGASVAVMATDAYIGWVYRSNAISCDEFYKDPCAGEFSPWGAEPRNVSEAPAAARYTSTIPQYCAPVTNGLYCSARAAWAAINYIDSKFVSWIKCEPMAAFPGHKRYPSYQVRNAIALCGAIAPTFRTEDRGEYLVFHAGNENESVTMVVMAMRV